MASGESVRQPACRMFWCFVTKTDFLRGLQPTLCCSFPKDFFQRSLSLVCPARYRDTFIDTIFKDVSLLYVKRLPSALLRKQPTLLSRLPPPPPWVPCRTMPCSPGWLPYLVNKGLLFLFQDPHCPLECCPVLRSGSA